MDSEVFKLDLEHTRIAHQISYDLQANVHIWLYPLCNCMCMDLDDASILILGAFPLKVQRINFKEYKRVEGAAILSQHFHVRTWF